MQPSHYNPLSRCSGETGCTDQVNCRHLGGAMKRSLIAIAAFLLGCSLLLVAQAPRGRGQASYPIAAGDSIFIPANMPHQFFVEKGKHWVITIVKVPPKS